MLQPNVCSSHLCNLMVAMDVHIAYILVKQLKQVRGGIRRPTPTIRKIFELGILKKELMIKHRNLLNLQWNLQFIQELKHQSKVSEA